MSNRHGIEPGTTCEFCLSKPAGHVHHVAQGSEHRQASDGMPELKLFLCPDCHDVLHDQKAKREIGLALCHLAGRASIPRLLDLYWKVTKRSHFPNEEKVRAWVRRLKRVEKPSWL